MPASVLFVDDYPQPNVGGGELHLLRLAEGCRSWGYRVGVVCAPGSGLEELARSQGYDVWPVRMGRGSLGARRRLARLFAEVSPDIVHVHGFNAMLAACPAARDAGIGSVLVTVHNMPSAPRSLRPGPLGEAEYQVRSLLYRRAAPSVDRFVCVVSAARDELAEIGIAPSKLIVIANGIPDPAEAISPDGDRSGERLRIGSVGRLEPLKGYEYLVSAAAIVLKARPDIEFRLVGDGSLRESLRSQVEAAGIGDRFVFAGWSDDALGEIDRMDVYAVSSVTDTTNLTILEAMGLGKPVVATKVGGISDAIADATTGYLVPPRQPELLAEKLLALANDSELRRQMGAEARKRFSASFTVARMLEQHQALYDRVLG